MSNKFPPCIRIPTPTREEWTRALAALEADGVVWPGGWGKPTALTDRFDTYTEHTELVVDENRELMYGSRGNHGKPYCDYPVKTLAELIGRELVTLPREKTACGPLTAKEWKTVQTAAPLVYQGMFLDKYNCLSLDGMKTYCSERWYKEQGLTILTFEQTMRALGATVPVETKEPSKEEPVQEENAPFNPGDPVECVDAKDSYGLELGRVYVVRKACPAAVWVEGDEHDVGRLSSRFKLASPVLFKAGDVVECVDASGSGDVRNFPFKVGSIHTVTKTMGVQEDVVEVEGRHFWSRRFKLASTAPAFSVGQQVRVCSKPPSCLQAGSYYWYDETKSLCGKIGIITKSDDHRPGGFEVKFSGELAKLPLLNAEGKRWFHASWLTAVEPVSPQRQATEAVRANDEVAFVAAANAIEEEDREALAQVAEKPAEVVPEHPAPFANAEKIAQKIAQEIERQICWPADQQADFIVPKPTAGTESCDKASHSLSEGGFDPHGDSWKKPPSPLQRSTNMSKIGFKPVGAVLSWLGFFWTSVLVYGTGVGLNIAAMPDDPKLSDMRGALLWPKDVVLERPQLPDELPLVDAPDLSRVAWIPTLLVYCAIMWLAGFKLVNRMAERQVLRDKIVGENDDMHKRITLWLMSPFVWPCYVAALRLTKPDELPPGSDLHVKVTADMEPIVAEINRMRVALDGALKMKESK